MTKKASKARSSGVPPADKPTGHARGKAAPEKKAPKKAARIQHIVELMCSGCWVRGVTGVELAAEWSLHVSTVEADAAEASRIVRGLVADDDELKAMILQTLQTITRRAMHRGQLRTAVESLKAIATTSGVDAPKKVNVGGSLADVLALGLAASGDGADPEVGE